MDRKDSNPNSIVISAINGVQLLIRIGALPSLRSKSILIQLLFGNDRFNSGKTCFFLLFQVLFWHFREELSRPWNEAVPRRNKKAKQKPKSDAEFDSVQRMTFLFDSGSFFARYERLILVIFFSCSGSYCFFFYKLRFEVRRNGRYRRQPTINQRETVRDAPLPIRKKIVERRFQSVASSAGSRTEIRHRRHRHHGTHSVGRRRRRGRRGRCGRRGRRPPRQQFVPLLFVWCRVPMMLAMVFDIFVGFIDARTTSSNAQAD